MLTVKCTVALLPAAIERPDQVTVPPEFVPPLSAETKLVLAGTGSVIVTPVAAALPMFFSVSVYVTLLDGPTGFPAPTTSRRRCTSRTGPRRCRRRACSGTTGRG